MFDKVKEIVEHIQKNKKLFNDFNDELKKQLTVRDMKAYVEKTGFNPKVCTIENKILFDNAVVEMLDEVLPKFVEIWNKYVGKRYGDKTKEKIRDELKEATGCWIYVVCGTYSCDEIHISVARDADEFLSTFFGYKSLDTPLKYGENLVDENTNKIMEVSIESMKPSWRKAYCEDTIGRTQSIIQKSEELEKKFKSYLEEVKELNDLLPSTIDRIYISEPSWYRIS